MAVEAPTAGRALSVDAACVGAPPSRRARALPDLSQPPPAGGRLKNPLARRRPVVRHTRSGQADGWGGGAGRLRCAQGRGQRKGGGGHLGQEKAAGQCAGGTRPTHNPIGRAAAAPRAAPPARADARPPAGALAAAGTPRADQLSICGRGAGGVAGDAASGLCP